MVGDWVWVPRWLSRTSWARRRPLAIEISSLLAMPPGTKILAEAKSAPHVCRGVCTMRCKFPIMHTICLIKP